MMDRRLPYQLCLVAGILAVTTAVPFPAFAQVHLELEAFQQIEFNFFPPGARASAMGGAFIGLADDATAAITNPAGLTRLLRPEIALQGKWTDPAIQRFSDPNSLFTLQPTDFGNKVVSPAFISFVWPTKTWAIAIYRHEFLRVKDDYHLDSRPIPGWEARNGRFLLVDGSFDFLGTNYGISIAGSMGRLDWGISLRLAVLESLNLIRHDHCLPDPIRACQRGSIAHIETVDDKANGFGATIGFIWRLSPRLQFGLVGDLNPTFLVTDDQRYSERPDGTGEDPRQLQKKIGIPNRVGVGITFRPLAVLVINSDIVWVQYSRLVNRENPLTFQDLYTAAITSDQFFMRDRVEWHTGAEYLLFVGHTAIALRGGFFITPRRRVHYRLPVAADSPARTEDFRFEVDAANLLYNALTDETLVGFSAGLGFVIPPVQLDVAYSTSDASREFTASLVFQF